jgi:hypothetical protein
MDGRALARVPDDELATRLPVSLPRKPLGWEALPAVEGSDRNPRTKPRVKRDDRSEGKRGDREQARPAQGGD